MTKLIARRKELMLLSEVTNNFEDVAKCGDTNHHNPKAPRFLTKYEALIKEASDCEELKEAGFKKEGIKGFIFGEPFFNFWLIEHGKALGIQWSRIATKTEDFNGGDAFGTRYESEEDEELIFQHKMHRADQEVTQEHLAGLGWAPLTYKPVLVSTAWEATFHIKGRIEERKGAYILRQDILEGTENPNFWRNFADLLRDNVIEQERRTKEAEEKARILSNRKLDAWQKQDLKTLSSLDRGIIIAPPGSGKTTLEAKLTEQWMEKDS